MKSQVPKFVKLFGLKHPVVQSPMAGASTVELAASVTNLGAMGSIPLGGLMDSPEAIKSQFKQFQDLTNGSRKVNLNFFAHEVTRRDELKERNWCEKQLSGEIDHLELLYRSFVQLGTDDEVVRLLLELQPAIISFHFGIPDLNVVKLFQGAGIKIFISATSLSEFQQLVEAGVDGVVLQGYEAGGHRGNFIANDLNDEKLSLSDLVKTVVDYVDGLGPVQDDRIPLIVAAGGLYNGLVVRDILKTGIAAVQLGTIWFSCEDKSLVNLSSKHRELLSQQHNTLMTPAISGRNLRTIETDLISQLASSSDPSLIPDYPLPYTVFKKNPKFKAYLAGANYYKQSKQHTTPASILEDIANCLRT